MTLSFSNLDLGVICGGVRRFKTLHLVRMMKEAKDIGYKIYTNVSLSSSFGSYTSIDSVSPEKAISDIRSMFSARITQRDYSNTFLGIDQFSGVADAVSWKKNIDNAELWVNLGKLGITTYVTNQAFSMTYNRYRDNANIMVVNKRIDATHYLSMRYIQSSVNHEQYIFRSQRVYCAPDIFQYYDTHQVMYI